MTNQPIDALIRAASDALRVPGLALRESGWDAQIVVREAAKDTGYSFYVTLQIPIGYGMREPIEAGA